MNTDNPRPLAAPHPPERRTALRYILFDILSAMVAWALLFIFRKVGLEDLRMPDIGQVLSDGNFWRGMKDGAGKMERTRADHMGMMATVMNSLAVADVLEQLGVQVRVQTALEIRAVAEHYIRLKADKHLKNGRVVIFGCGTGNPYFSTDTAAVLRAAEIGAEVILLAKNIDGVYSADPRLDKDAVKFDHITYDEVLMRHLAVMDSTATSLSMDNQIPVLVFALKDPENIRRAIMGEKIGTIVE